MDRLKSFIYLDEYKLYSLYSQMFEGITEFLVSSLGTQVEEGEKQKGVLGSGRELVDLLRKNEAIHEKKYLHDYQYTIFEKKLLKEERVLEISPDSIEQVDFDFPSKPLVKIKSKAIFNDINSIKATLENFNNLGEALAYVTNFKNLKEVESQLNQAKNTIKDRNQKADLQRQYNSFRNISKLAKEQGLHQDGKFLEKLNMLLTYGYQDQFEVQLNVCENVFTANLNRNYLREKESTLIRKYSRITEREFVLFGMVSQVNNPMEFDQEDNSDEPESMKQALMLLFEQLANIENQFTGRLSNEIIVDPIAIYTEL